MGENEEPLVVRQGEVVRGRGHESEDTAGSPVGCPSCFAPVGHKLDCPVSTWSRIRAREGGKLPLTFERLAEVNGARSRVSFAQCSDWTLGDWGCALAGETGELCNKLKKLRRGEKVPNEALAEELADVVLYADLIAGQLGIDLGEAVRCKFNSVSAKRGAEEYL